MEIFGVPRPVFHEFRVLGLGASIRLLDVQMFACAFHGLLFSG